MNICDDCKNNKNGWCKYFSIKISKLGKLTTCIGYKKKSNKTNNIKRQSIKQEKQLTKDLKAKRTPKSGGISTSPNDMVKGNYVIESKATKGKSISVKEEWLRTLKYSPINLGKIPTLILEFPNKQRYVILDEKDFKKILKDK